MPRRDVLGDFERKTDRSNGEKGCWLWMGEINHNGYGRFQTRSDSYEGSSRRRKVPAHRFALEVSTAVPVPASMQIDHLCRTRNCVNPAHLEVVTARENNLRSFSVAGQNARAVRCAVGHPLSGLNLYVTPDGRRQCRDCRRDSTRMYRQRKRGVHSVA